MDEDKKSRIVDNPSVQEISSVLPVIRAAEFITRFLKSLGLNGGKVERIHEKTMTALAQSDVLYLPDRFNEAFADKGWIATSSMSVDVMREALVQHDNGNFVAAEDKILAWLNEDRISLFAISRSKLFNKATRRWTQLREALALTIEERYMAAVPLILIASDGFASDVLGTSPFEKGADLTSFDSIPGHPTSLPTLIRKLVKGVRKSSDDELDLPLRHGILHGRSLGYANRLVCFKAWFLMIALVDWAIDKRDEEERVRKHSEREDRSWKEIAENVRKLNADKREMEEFQAREWHAPFERELNEDSPVFAFRDFLEAWKSKNYGAMAKRAVNITQIAQKRLAGCIRNDAELVELIEFEIRSVRQSSVVRADAEVFLRGKTLQGEVQGEFEILGFRHTLDGDIAMPADEGYWAVQQGCILDLMHKRTIETKKDRRR